MQTSDICLVPGGVTGENVMNMIRGIRYAKDNNMKNKDKNHAAIVATKAA